MKLALQLAVMKTLNLNNFDGVCSLSDMKIVPRFGADIKISPGLGADIRHQPSNPSNKANAL